MGICLKKVRKVHLKSVRNSYFYSQHFSQQLQVGSAITACYIEFDLESGTLDFKAYTVATNTGEIRSTNNMVCNIHSVLKFCFIIR